MRLDCKNNCKNGYCNDQAVCICDLEWTGPNCTNAITGDVIQKGSGLGEGGYIGLVIGGILMILFVIAAGLGVDM